MFGGGGGKARGGEGTAEQKSVSRVVVAGREADIFLTTKNVDVVKGYAQPGKACMWGRNSRRRRFQSQNHWNFGPVPIMRTCYEKITRKHFCKSIPSPVHFRKRESSSPKFCPSSPESISFLHLENVFEVEAVMSRE